MSATLSSRSTPRPVVARPPQQLGTVVVTGASSGIGKATALHLAALGHRVLAGVRSASDFERLEQHPGVEPVVLDITEQRHIDALVELLEHSVPEGISALVNNAGIVALGPVELLDAEDWRQVMDVNVHGTIALTTALLPSLLRARGRVINIGSAAGKVALPLFAPYAASKFALEAFNDALRREVRDSGVRVICVAPGAMATPIFDKHLESAFVYEEGAADRYERLIRGARTSAAQASVGAPPPTKVAKVVGQAIGSRRPRARYMVAWDSRAADLCARLMSPRLADFALRVMAPR